MPTMATAAATGSKQQTAREKETQQRRDRVNTAAAAFSRSQSDHDFIELADAIRPLIGYFIRRYWNYLERNNAITADDCEQAALLHVLKAARAYNPASDHEPATGDNPGQLAADFVAYAAPAIQRAILQTINSAPVQMMPSTISADQLAYKVSDADGESVLDMIPDENAIDPAEQAERISTIETVRAAVAALDRQHCQVIEKRLAGMTFAQIAGEIGVSCQRVQAIEREGYKKLRDGKYLKDYGRAWRKWSKTKFQETWCSIVEVTAFPELGRP